MTLTKNETAELAQSINVHTKSRPLDPITVAERLRILVNESGSTLAVARMFGLKNDTMIRRFLSLLTLPDTVRDFIGWGGTKERKIGIDMAYRISTLSSDAEKDSMVKIIINSESHGRPITKKELQSIITLKHKNPKLALEDCATKILSSRPASETTNRP